MRRQDQRRPGSVVFSWVDGVSKRDKRVIEINHDEDDLLAIARAFVDNILNKY